MTGITRVSKESIFSDLNNLKVVTTTSDEHGAAFGFTEEEVFAALDEFGMSDRKPDVKITMEDLLHDRIFHTVIDEQIVFSQLDRKTSAVCRLLLASGYLRGGEHFTVVVKSGRAEYDLKLTNGEVRLMFEQMIEDWFSEYTSDYNDFIKALLLGDRKLMNRYMNKVALATFSFFDVGNRPSAYAETLVAKGIPKERIRKYGFAFEGKEVLIG